MLASSLLLTVLNLGLLVLAGYAFVDCVRQPAAAFPAAGKLTKPAWLGITGVSTLLCLTGVVGVIGLLGAVVAVGCIVYLVDVKPAVSVMRPGSGPYGVSALVTGSGLPVTLVAHGLGGSPADTRPLVGGVAGTKVFPSARGHGGVPLGEAPVDYALLGRDLEQVADEHGATQALGVSMGAGALLSLLARRPDRLARVVLLLPAAVDRPRADDAVRSRLALADALDAGNAEGVAAGVAQELPEDLHDVPGVRQYLAARAAYLRASPGFAGLVRALPAAVPVADRSALGAVEADVLLLAQEGDPLHPAQVARDLAAVLPRARLVVFAQPGAVVRERARLRALVQDFLAG